MIIISLRSVIVISLRPAGSAAIMIVILWIIWINVTTHWILQNKINANFMYGKEDPRSTFN
jgi:hypothetical protein